MSNILQTAVEVGNISTVMEQKLATGTDFTGVAPSLTGKGDFVPFYDSETGIYRMRSSDGIDDEGDAGGLFAFSHTQPIVIIQVLADFGGAAADWSLSIATSAGDIPIDSKFDDRYLTLKDHEKVTLLPGEALKISCNSTSANQWARAYARLQQSIP